MNGCKTEIVKANDDISLVSGGFTLNKLSESNIYIDIIDYIDITNCSSFYSLFFVYF